jgi:hypothetical protein
MRVEIEFLFSGTNHFDRFYRFDDYLNKMVRGFSFRMRPLFIVVMYFSK